MPPWLKLLLHPVQGLTSVSVKPLSLFYKLLATVLAPALIGKVGRSHAMHAWSGIRCVLGGLPGGRLLAAPQAVMDSGRACLQLPAPPRLSLCLPSLAARCASQHRTPSHGALQAARELLPPVRRFATKYKVQLGMFNTLNLACIIWQTLSDALVGCSGGWVCARVTVAAKASSPSIFESGPVRLPCSICRMRST